MGKAHKKLQDLSLPGTAWLWGQTTPPCTDLQNVEVVLARAQKSWREGNSEKKRLPPTGPLGALILMLWSTTANCTICTPKRLGCGLLLFFK